jgi:phosphatidylglycerophosphate synthase
MPEQPTATAVLVVDDPEDAWAAGDVDGSVLSRLVGQLAGRGVGRVAVIARPAAASRVRAAGLPVRESPDVASDLRLIADEVRRGMGPLIVAAGNLVVSDTVVAGVVAGAGDSVVAVTGEWGASVRVDRGRVISAGSVWHQVTSPTAYSVGLFRIGGGARAVVAEALADAAPMAETAVSASDALAAEAALGAGRAFRTGGAFSAGGVAVATRAPDPVDLALVAVVRAGVPVLARSSAGLVCTRVTDQEDVDEAMARVAGIDEDAVRLRASVKSDDDLFATYCVSSWSPVLVRLAARCGLRPTGVTWLSVLASLTAAVGFAQGGRGAAVAGAVLLYLGFVLDCVDGQLARYTQHFTRYGGWLDAIADRGKEYAVYAGLAVGAAHAGLGDVWPFAIAAMVLLTVRHMTDCWYGVARDEAVAQLAPASLWTLGDAVDGGSGGAPGGAGAGSGPRAVASLIRATNDSRRSVLHWVKKLMVFPIGERWALIAVCAAIGNARMVFGAVLGWGTVAAGYALGVRLLLTWRARTSAFVRHDVATYRDDGVLARLLGTAGRGVVGRGVVGRAAVAPLPTAGMAVLGGIAFLVAQAEGLRPGVRATATAVAVFLLARAALAGRHPHAGPLDWLVPGALRAAELTVVVGAGTGLRVPRPLIFALVLVIALFHYDLAARLEKAGSPLRWRAMGLGWDGRLLVIAASVLVASGFDPSFELAVPVFGHVGPAVVVWVSLTGYLVVAFLAGALVGLGESAGSAVRRRPVPRQDRGADDETASSQSSEAVLSSAGRTTRGAD